MQPIKELRSLFSNRYLKSLILLTKHQLGKQYRYSFLGMMWTLIMPSIQILVYAFVFGALLKVPHSKQALYIMVGVIPWAFINNSIMSGAHSLLANSHAIKRCIISKTMFPLSTVLHNLHLFFISFGCLYLVALFLYIKFSFTILFLPLAIIPIFIFTASATVMVSFITPYIRDINEFVNVIFLVGFYATPILYQIDFIPEDKRIFFKMNPFYQLLQPLYDVAFLQIIPTLKHLIYSYGLAIVMLIISYFVYRKLRERVIYYF